MRYPIVNSAKLIQFLQEYLPRVIQYGINIGLDLKQTDFGADHFGLQVLDKSEFDAAHHALTQYCTLTHEDIIHDRRNNIYQFNYPIEVGGFRFRGIEIFEPKPKVDRTTLRPGIEHVAFVCKDLSKIATRLDAMGLVAKDATYSRGRFIKTQLNDGIEIELRDTSLI